MWYINVNATYYEYSTVIRELVVMKYCNCDAILKRKNVMLLCYISAQRSVFITAVSSTEPYHPFIK